MTGVRSEPAVGPHHVNGRSWPYSALAHGYAPAKRIELVRTTRKSVGNTTPVIKLADPRLINEFRRKVGHTSFVIASLATLVEGLSKSSPAQFAHLAAAIQINIQDSAPAMPLAAEEAVTPAAGEPSETSPTEVPVATPVLPVEVPVEHPPVIPAIEPAEPVAPRLRYDLEALQDAQYQADAPSDTHPSIRYCQGARNIQKRLKREYGSSPALCLMPQAASGALHVMAV